jgi:hypothetical protein
MQNRVVSPSTRAVLVNARSVGHSPRTGLAVMALCACSAAASGAVVTFTNSSTPNQSLVWSDTELPGRETIFRSGAAPLRVPVTLSIDPDGNGPAPATSRAATFNIAGIFYETGGLLYYQRSSVAEGYQHEYNFRAGTIDLRDGTDPNPNAGELLLRLTFDNFIFRTTSPSEEFWGDTGTLTPRFGPPTNTFRTISGSLASQFGSATENFAFVLTNLRDREFGGPVPLRVGNSSNPDLTAGDPALPWQSDGGFTITLVPAPGSLGLCGVIALSAARRRR